MSYRIRQEYSHAPHHADVAIGDAAERPEEQGLPERGRETEAEARQHCEMLERE